MDGKVTWQEVVEVLEKIGRGEIVPQAIGQTWDQVYAGDVVFQCGDWRITIFNDCDELDYVNDVVAPDGRVGEFNDWAGTAKDFSDWHEPASLMDRQLFQLAEDAFSRATPCAAPAAGGVECT